MLMLSISTQENGDNKYSAGHMSMQETMVYDIDIKVYTD